MNLELQAQQPMDRAQLADFVDELATSLALAPTDWENADLESFLRGLAGWLADMEGYFANRAEAAPVSPTWELVAQMLLAARVYE